MQEINPAEIPAIVVELLEFMDDNPGITTPQVIQQIKKIFEKRKALDEAKQRIEELKTPRLKELLYKLHCTVEAEKVTLGDVRPGLR